MATIDDLITWAHKEPTPDNLHKASNLADELSEEAFMENIQASRQHVLEIVALLWPAA